MEDKLWLSAWSLSTDAAHERLVLLNHEVLSVYASILIAGQARREVQGPDMAS